MNTIEINLTSSRIMPVVAGSFYIVACIVPWFLIQAWGWYLPAVLSSIVLLAGIPCIRFLWHGQMPLAITLVDNVITQVQLKCQAPQKVIAVDALRILSHYLEIKLTLDNQQHIHLCIFPDMLLQSEMRLLRRALLTNRISHTAN